MTTVVFPFVGSCDYSFVLAEFVVYVFGMYNFRFWVLFCFVVVVVSVAYLCEVFGCHEAVWILNLGV